MLSSLPGCSIGDAVMGLSLMREGGGQLSLLTSLGGRLCERASALVQADHIMGG